MQQSVCSSRSSPDRRAWLPTALRIAGAVALALGTPLLTPGAARAQEGVVAGMVVGGPTQQPVVGAQVTVQGTNRGAITDNAGRFRITGVDGPTVTLTVRRLGFRPITREVQVGQQDIRLALTETAVELSEVVVTGTAGAQEKREIGNAVATVRADELVETAPIKSMQELLNGRAPGVFVAPATGMVGSGQKIRVRGQSTFSLSGDPLVYIDGARVNNEIATGLVVQAFGSGVVSRMNDINPEDIERIEILKGPAAATLYGTEAARGVINIITKRGSTGRAQYSLTVRQGAQWFYDPEGRLPVNYFQPRDGGGNPVGPLQTLNLYRLEKERGIDVFRTGHLQGYTLGVSGGGSDVRYYLSGDLDRDQGVDPTNWRDQFSGRANIVATPSEKIDLSVSAGYVRNDTHLACEAGCGGRMWGLLFSSPEYLVENCPPDADFGCGITRGYNSWPPEPQDALDMFQNVHRFTGSLTMNWRPFRWLTNRVTVGRDVTNEENTELLPYLANDTLRFFWGDRWSNGYRYENLREVIFDTYDYAGSVNFDVRPELKSTTSLGVQYYTKFFEFVGVQGEGFPGLGPNSVNAAANKTFQEQNYWDNKTLGAYLQQQFGWRDRLFVTGAVRVDNNSAFGADVDFVTYPKASVSWVLGEEPFFQDVRPSWVNTLRLRGAYGESGQQPEIFSALRTFLPVPGPGGTPAVTPEAVGNPDLKPERGRELELGFDAGLLNDRLGVDFTYYRTLTRDAILSRPLPPSGGFPGSQWVNAGEILNSGIELGLRGTIMNGRRFGWDANLNLATNGGEVRKLSGADTTIVAGSVQHRIGYPAWSWFRERVVSAEFDPVTGRAINAMCDDGKGGATPCFSASGAVIAPRVYLGRTTPSTEGAVTSTLRFFDRFRLYGMVDFKRGFKKWDNNLRVRCQIFRTCEENIRELVLANPGKYDPRAVAQMQTSGTLVDFVINDAGFARLREVSLGVDLPTNWVRRFGGRGATLNIAARNLHTWTNYTGLDPEVMFLGGSITFQFEQDQIPHSRQFVTTLNVTF